MSIPFILYEIEQCRAEMISLSKKYGMTSDEIIRTSKRLDGLLNEYQRLKETAGKEYTSKQL